MERISSGGLETELRLGLPGGEVDQKNEKKRVFSDLVGGEGEAESKLNGVVGWPPVAGFRRKSGFGGGKRYVKVSMDGAPFLRKVDLDLHKGYSQLVKALEHLFGCYGGGGIAAAAAAGEVKLDEENTSNSEYVGIYQDKDGDWMLLGDVPWQMFTESCKRLRIMKRADANGHAKDLLKGLSKQDY